MIVGKSGVSKGVKGAFDIAQRETKALDEKLHLSETARGISKSIGQKAEEVDGTLKISETFDKAMHSEPVQKVSSFFASMTSAFVETANSIIKDATGEKSPTKDDDSKPNETDEVEELFKHPDSSSPSPKQ